MALIQQAKKIRAERSFEIVGLTGGVFKNKRLNEYVNTLLQAEGFKVLMPKQIPNNDAGISFGQIIEAGTILSNKE